MRELTEQEHFWRGDFGEDYAERIGSVLEWNTNTGNNLRALSGLLPGCELSGVEINADFASEVPDRYSDLQLLDYGFVYRRDPQFPVDDITWFVLEKRP